MTTDPFERGRFSHPVQHGCEVHRRPLQDNTGVHALLAHFERIGVTLTPRFLGFTPAGAERLSFVEGDTGYPPLSKEVRSDAALVSVAKAIRRVHDASRGFIGAGTYTWHVNEVSRGRDIDCIGHHDLAPWNIVFEGTEVRGIIDWDTAGPSNRVWDLAYAAYQFVPMHPEADLSNWGWQVAPNRRERLATFANAYGLGVQPSDLVTAAEARIRGIGTYIAQEVARGNSHFAVHAREDHAAAYTAAAATLASHRDDYV